MLRYVTLGCAYTADDFLYADLAFTKDTKDFQSQWMRHGLERPGGLLDVFFPMDEFFSADAHDAGSVGYCFHIYLWIYSIS